MKKKSVRDAIVNTAARLFYRQGYSNTGINQIIEEAHVAKSSLYQHFHSKEDLLIAYLDLTGEKTLAALQEIAAQQTTPREKLIAIFDYLEGLMRQEDFYGCHFLNMVYELPEQAYNIKDLVKKQKDGVRTLFKDILAPVHREELADEIYTLFEGALIGNKIHGDPWPIVAAGNIVKKLL
jgi:AcrR family transcriptional regulator